MIRRPEQRVAVGSMARWDPPPLPPAPVDASRDSLYSPHELYDGIDRGYSDCLDAHVHAWALEPRTPGETMLQALHDHAMDEALARYVAGRRLVGVMGGHGLARTSAEYADAARLGRTLGGSWTVATGGGPGAMEAANLGAVLAGSAEQHLEQALTDLAAVPTYAPDPTAWARTALAVAEQVGPSATPSLGIPTWHYGHEPPNAFATAIAKYFRNATREAILLEVCDAGIVFLPGSAGTLQEVFQDACENYYADPDEIAPMVLVGRRYWTERLPAWPLLSALAADRPMAGRIHLVDSTQAAFEVLRTSG